MRGGGLGEIHKLALVRLMMMVFGCSGVEEDVV